ncbi:hypothetical protein G7Y89_g13556 [Cudoniella acicularis]|uniref:G domain-containing protein n=1 Tax=Cudoniella acicularis TaxID=354080 RepID=A0A8H4VWB3_9HELO|nr:hypothetical protein G7Y89_g13556 [Cudoniella acicularis]
MCKKVILKEEVMSGNMEDVPPQYTPLGDSLKALEVLIVGESQQGKSTLIKQLNRYSDQPNIDIGIGHGNLACTKVVRQYTIATELTRHQLVSPDGRPIEGLDYTELCDLDRTEAKVVPIAQQQPGQLLNFNFIDTPGLDDSDGEDIELMAAIIGRLGEISHINAVIYVRNINKPFSKSFKQFFSYIQRSLPSLSAGLIIVHTCFTVQKVAEFLDDSKNLAALKRDAFKAATSLELMHFFMDSEPSKYSPLAVLESLNSCYKLLSYLSSQRPLPIAGLRLLKTANMANYDSQVIATLMELKLNLQQEWNAANAQKSANDQRIYSAQLEITKLNRKLAKSRDRLSRLESGPDIVLGSRAVAEDYSWQAEVKLGSRQVDYIAECPIAYVTKTANGGSHWQDEVLQGNVWSAVITSSSFRDLGGTATLYARSKDKHWIEIKQLKERCVEYEEQILYMERSLQGDGGDDVKLKVVGDNVDRVGSLVDTLKMEKFDIGLYNDLRRFYANRHRPSRDEIKEFVQAYDKGVAKLIN